MKFGHIKKLGNMLGCTVLCFLSITSPTSACCTFIWRKWED